MAVTPYPYAVGKDPTYDAWYAKASYNKTVAGEDTALRKRQANEQYQQALASLADREKYGTRNIDNSMLARGVYSSGETSRRQGEFAAAMLKSRSQAGTARQNTLGQLDSAYQRALHQFDLDQEAQVQAAMNRARAGSGGSRTSTTSTTMPNNTNPYAGTPWGNAMGAINAGYISAPRPQVPIVAANPYTWQPGQSFYDLANPNGNKPNRPGLPTLVRY